MKRFTKSSIALAILLSLPVVSVYAAEPLSAKESSKLVPVKEVAVRGTYAQAQDAAKDISKVADESGAKFYHIKGMEAAASDNTSNTVVYADIFESNTPVLVNKKETVYNGVVAYGHNRALYFLPFEVINFKGSFNNTSEITEAASKAAAANNAYAFYVDSIYPTDTKGQYQNVDVALYKKDAAVRDYITKTSSQDQDAYEISSDAVKTMKPYRTITFHGDFNNTSEVTAAAEKQAIASGAHFYYISDVSPNASGTVKTVYLNLYK